MSSSPVGGTRRIVSIEIPLPGKACSPNGNKGSWAAKHRATKAQRLMAHLKAVAILREVGPIPAPVIIHHTWYMGETGQEQALAHTRQAIIRAGGQAKAPRSPALFYRPLDQQNAISAIKGALDGIVASGLLAGDQHDKLSWGRCELLRTAKQHGGRSCVVIEIEYEVARDQTD